jgi:hypothetical protein
MNRKYDIEIQLGQLLKEIRLSVARIVRFLTHIPKNKGERMAWCLELIAWMFLTFSIILKIRGW